VQQVGLLEDYAGMHGQQNIKLGLASFYRNF